MRSRGAISSVGVREVVYSIFITYFVAVKTRIPVPTASFIYAGSIESLWIGNGYRNRAVRVNFCCNICQMPQAFTPRPLL